MTLEAARDLIDRDYARPLSVTRLAKQTARSPFQFIRAFRREYGVTPGQHLRARRIARARELLTTTPLPITEIGRRVGYRSLGTFSRVFRVVIGRVAARLPATHPHQRLHPRMFCPNVPRGSMTAPRPAISEKRDEASHSTLSAA